MTSKKQPFVLVLIIGLGLIPSSASGGASPMLVEPAARAHHFFDAKNLCLQSLSVIALAADVASTRQALKAPGAREMNPFAGSQTALISLKIAGAGASLGIAYMMHHTGHYKAERVVPVIFGMPSALAAVHNFGIKR
ncbi:MAG: hypothetical protein ACLQVG_00310 [Terriglobia bacterium]